MTGLRPHQEYFVQPFAGSGELIGITPAKNDTPRRTGSDFCGWNLNSVPGGFMMRLVEQVRQHPALALALGRK